MAVSANKDRLAATVGGMTHHPSPVWVPTWKFGVPSVPSVSHPPVKVPCPQMLPGARRVIQVCQMGQGETYEALQIVFSFI